MKQIALEKSTIGILEEFSIKSGIYEEPSLIKSLKELRSYKPLPSETKKKEVCTKYLVRNWFSQRIRRKYDELSPDIFELKREVEIGKEHFEQIRGRGDTYDSKLKIEIPMFVQAELKKDKGWKDEFSCDIFDDDHFLTYKISLSSRMPKTPLNVRQAGREAIGFTYKVYGDALATEVLNEVISEHPDYAPHPQNSKLLVLWKPKPSEIHVKARRLDNDPALVLNWDRPYLVSTWKEPNEEPFMHLISACKMPNLEMFLDKTR